MTTPSPTTISRSLDVDASPELVWRLVSDLPNMGKLSPENTGGSWLGDATAAAVGARFRGANRRGWRRWSTQVTVTECEVGRRFAFEVTSLGLRVAQWSYDVAARPGGCTVTESWHDRRGPAMGVLGRLATGVADRTSYTVDSIDRTLAAVKSRAEQA